MSETVFVKNVPPPSLSTALKTFQEAIFDFFREFVDINYIFYYFGFLPEYELKSRTHLYYRPHYICETDPVIEYRLKRNRDKVLKKKKLSFKTLRYACAYNRPDIIKLIIESKKVDINHRDRYNSTPVQICSYTRNYECLKLLIQAGANTDGIVKYNDIEFLNKFYNKNKSLTYNLLAKEILNSINTKSSPMNRAFKNNGDLNVVKIIVEYVV